MERAAILEKIKKREDDHRFFERAIEVCVCPDCGEDLTRKQGSF